MHAWRPHGALRLAAAWIAALAVLLAAVAPTVSRAVASDSLTAWSEVCTENGARWVDTETGGQRSASLPAGDSSGWDHCAYCVLQHHAADLPPAPQVPALQPPTPFAHYLVAFAHSPRTLFAWSQARPRGPPKLS